MKAWIVILIIILMFLGFLGFGLFKIKQAIDNENYTPIIPNVPPAVTVELKPTSHAQKHQTIELPSKQNNASKVFLDKRGIGTWLYDVGIKVLPVNDKITVCSGYGCVFKTKYRIHPKIYDEVEKVAQDVSGPASERLLIPKMIMIMKQEVSKAVGIRDVPGSSFFGNGKKDQMNDRDELINTAQYLWVLVERGLIKYNNILEPTSGWISGGSNVIQDPVTKTKYNLSYDAKGDVILKSQ